MGRNISGPSRPLHCLCVPRERARAAPPLVGRLRLQPGARCTLETPAGLVGQMHGKYWTTLPPPCKNFASGSESGCTAKECLPLCAEAREEGGRDDGFPSLSVQMRCCRVISVSPLCERYLVSGSCVQGITKETFTDLVSLLTFFALTQPTSGRAENTTNKFSQNLRMFL